MHFAANHQEFRRTLKYVLPSTRKGQRDVGLLVEMRAGRNRLRISCEQPATVIEVRTLQSGRAWIPLRVMAGVTRMLRVGGRVGKQAEIEVEIETGALRVGSFRVTHGLISLKAPRAVADLPGGVLDNSLLELLAFAAQAGAAKVAMAGLQARVAEAQARAQAAVNAATLALRPLAIDNDRVAAFVQAEIRRRAGVKR